MAGLPLQTLDAFATRLCAAASLADAAEAELRSARAELADRLHGAVPAAAPEVRRRLLAVRRDCHNGRPLGKHRAAPEWPAVEALAPECVARVAEREARVDDARSAYQAAFDAERARQRAALRDALHDREFLRGLALASPDLFAAARQLRDAPPGEPVRREERAETALLRYLSRAAAKVSPFSTFTRLALGTLRPSAGAAGLRLRGAGWAGRSLVRVKRYRLQQYTDVLCRYPGFRDGLDVVLNDSAVQAEPGRLLFVRPGRWEADAARGRLVYRPDALVRTALQGVAARAAELLSAEPMTYGALVARLRGEPGAEDALAHLLDVGFLRVVLPWPVHEAHLEARMCAHLRTLPPDPALAPFIDRLERLVACEHAFAAADDPAAVLRDIHRLTDALWHAVAPLGGIDPGVAAYRGPSTYDVYEDVLLAPPAGRPDAPAFHLSLDAARDALGDAAPLVRLGTLFDHAHELRATLADFAAERWPGRDEVPAMELFHAAQPLWREYMAFQAEGWKERDLRRTWNPRGLAALEALRAARGAVLDALPDCAADEGGVRRVDGAALDALLDRLAAAYTAAPGRGACLLLQPASRDGSLWRLNGTAEGTGRMGSRFTAVMPPRMRGRYTGHLARRGAVMADGERALLLDVQCVQGDTLNVHAPQTPRVLAFPGDAVDAPGERRRALRALRVRFEGPERRPVVRGADGERLLPVHLGLAFEAYMPPLHRFLCAFGPGGLRSVPPPRAWRTEGEVRVADRTVLGSLVLHRRAWSVPARALAGALQGDDAAAFAAVSRLRAGWGIPDRVFFAEPRPGPAGTVFKPQYLDFTSPLFLALLRAAVADPEARLTMEELLPEPEMCPADADGRRWAVEVVVDSAALAPPRARRRIRRRMREAAAAA